MHDGYNNYHDCRYESVGSPTYVIFFFHNANVVTCDPESVKVSILLRYLFASLIYMQAIIMHPEHGKDPSFLKNFAYLMGERYLIIYFCARCKLCGS